MKTLNVEELRSLAIGFGVPDEGQFRAFQQYYELTKRIMGKTGPIRILELGSGFSTALMAYCLGERSDVEIDTIDLSFETYEKAIKNSGIKVRDGLVNKFAGTTVTSEELKRFYDVFLEKCVFGISIHKLIAKSRFAEVVMDDRKFNYLSNRYGGGISQITNRMLEDPVFLCNLLDYYSNFGSFGKELELVERLPRVLTDEFCNRKWDVIYFDSGELSTNVECIKLERSFNPGALIGFHDVYFPKSFKSWLPCAALTMSNDWNVLYKDSSTSQGMLIAERS